MSGALILGFAVFLGSCGTLPSKRDWETGQPAAHTAYAAAVEATVRYVLELDPKVRATAGSLSTGTLEATSAAAESFSRRVDLYAKSVQAAEKSAVDSTVAQLEAALATLEELGQAAVEDAVRLSTKAAAVEQEYENVRRDSSSLTSLKSTRDYVAAVGALSRLSSEVRGFLHRVHLQPLVASSPPAPPAQVVLHFLRVRNLRDDGALDHGDDYAAAWKTWIAGKLTAGEIDSALEILAMVCRRTEEYRPETPQKLFEITYPALEKHLSLAAAQGMEVALSDIEKSFAPAGPEASWRRALVKARARVLFCQARALATVPQGPALARQALDSDPSLSTHVAKLLTRSAPALAGRRLAAFEYGEAIATFDGILALGNVEGRDTLSERYRSTVIIQALENARRDTANRKFAAAKKKLFSVEPLCDGPAHESKWRDAFLDCAARQSERYLAAGDTSAALDAARGALARFPSATPLKKSADRALAQQLAAKIGDLSTLHARMGGAEVLATFGQSVKGMLTLEGATACQRLLESIERTWSKRLAAEKEPARAFALAVEIARLSKSSEEEAVRQASDILWKRFAAATAAGDARRMEEAVDIYFARCRRVAPPATFQENYLQLIELLDEMEQTKKVGRHAALFSSLYPEDIARLEPLVSKHASEASPLRKGFGALLRRIEEAPSRQQKALAEDADVAFLIPLSELPAANGATGAAAVGQATSPAVAPKDSRGRDSRVGDSRVGGIGGLGYALGFVSLGAVIALVFVTLRAGTVAFRWYALAALMLGITAGFFFARWPRASSTPAVTPDATALLDVDETALVREENV